jgi:hypothetical protein
LAASMEQAKTARELGFEEPKAGYEWNAGSTPPGDSVPGCWLVRRKREGWITLFHAANGAEYVIHTFPPDEDGEREAKNMALKLVDFAWGK